MTTVFTSTTLSDDLLDPLLVALGQAHAERPLLPDDPRDVVMRVGGRLVAIGLAAVRIRGTVAWKGVEVDHVWLAVSGSGIGPFVLDASFPLHEPVFAGSLAGYVAGTTTVAELSIVAADSRLEDRVIGRFPPVASYRGQPFWGLAA